MLGVFSAFDADSVQNFHLYADQGVPLQLCP